MAGSLSFSSVNLLNSSLFFAPLHAAPNGHSEYVKLAFGHSDQPNSVTIPFFSIGPTHEPPGGHERHPGFPDSSLFATQKLKEEEKIL